MELSDTVLRHLTDVVERADLSGTRYELEGEIGRGGSGIVYAARDRELERRVAIKVIEPALAGEARLIAKLEHPGIVPVHETGVLPDGRIWYAMKLVRGPRLDRWIEDSPPLVERLRIVRRVGEALGYAHSCGVLHRDLKPQNIMAGAFGEVYVMDWGVEAIAGTPAFRAPDAVLDQRSDIYSLGAVLRFILPDGASPALQAIASKAVSADPNSRYRDAESLLTDIERFQQGLAVEAWREPFPYRMHRFISRNGVLLALLAAYLVVKIFLFLARSL